jgi:hypothetical protein
MRPHSPADNDQLDLFRAHFDQILNPDHPLVLLARKIDWQRFDAAFADCYCPDMGAPGKAIRFRGHDYRGDATIHVAGSSHSGLSRTKRKRRRRRSVVEPIIGHMKSDHGMGRCFLNGLLCDEINAILAAAGLNLRKLLRRFVFALISWFSRLAEPPLIAPRLPNPTSIAA